MAVAILDYLVILSGRMRQLCINSIIIIILCSRSGAKDIIMRFPKSRTVHRLLQSSHMQAVLFADKHGVTSDMYR